jgi:hypothetical protein
MRFTIVITFIALALTTYVQAGPISAKELGT